MNRQKQTTRILEALSTRYTNGDYPALMAQIRDWLVRRPLDGLRILDATPVFFNSLSKYAALLAGGADLTVAASDKMPFDPSVLTFLDGIGVKTAYNDIAGGDPYDAVLDCTAIHRDKSARLGYVELTRSGVHHYLERGNRVFLADSSRIKEIETCLGTGESCLRALRDCGFESISGKQVLLFGYGKVGRGIAFYLQNAGAELFVVDDSGVLEARLPHTMHGLDRAAPLEIRTAIRHADFVVSATGRPDALASFSFELNAASAVLLNMGAEDEYGPEIPESRVLNRKQPLNFMLEEPTLLRYIDPTLALHNAGAEFLCRAEVVPDGAILPPENMEAEILRAVLENGTITREIQQMENLQR